MTGLYDAVTQQRLPVVNSSPPSDSVSLFTIDVVH
jgi:hypothetical protein